MVIRVIVCCAVMWISIHWHAMLSMTCSWVHYRIPFLFYKIIFPFRAHLEGCSPKCLCKCSYLRDGILGGMCVFLFWGKKRTKELGLGINKCSNRRYTWDVSSLIYIHGGSHLHLCKRPPHCPRSVNTRKLIKLDGQIYTRLWAPQQPK